MRTLLRTLLRSGRLPSGFSRACAPLLLLAGAAAAPAAAAPSFLVVLTDDMRRVDLAYMPHVQALLGEGGATFDAFLASLPLCCPARVTLLRGQYAHNTGVHTNSPPAGGFETAYARGLEKATFATALQRAGYVTGYFGKYLNGYPGPGGGAAYVPPGWSTFLVPVSGEPYAGYDYVLMEEVSPEFPGARFPVPYGRTADDYATDVFAAKTADFIANAVAEGMPFLAFLSTYAPHFPATPAPRHRSLFEELAIPRAPSFGEFDVSDKPRHVSRLPAMRARFALRLEKKHRQRVRSLQAVDEAVAMLVGRLATLGRLDETYVLFTSDNGFHLGDHRMGWGKQSPYETDVNVPFLVRGPGVPPGATVGALAGNTDLAPTLVDLAGAELPYDPDGRSLRPWLHGELGGGAGGAARDGGDAWRQAFLLEHWRGTSRHDRFGKTRIPGYRGLRTRRHTYVEYDTGERELYDLAVDPHQLENSIAAADPALVSALSRRVAALRTCAGARCRALEDMPLPSSDAAATADAERLHSAARHP